MGASRRLAAQHFVDEGASLGEARVDYSPHDVTAFAAANREPLMLEYREVLRHIGPADLKGLGELAGRAGLLAK